MKETEISLHTRFQIALVDPRIFGGFLEHMGRAVYEGVYDPDSPHADTDGCRIGCPGCSTSTGHDHDAVSSGIGMKSYMDWDRQVLGHLGDLVDNA